MKILFTKTSVKKEISEQLGNYFSYDFVEVIGTSFNKIQVFDLENRSLIFTSKNAAEAFFENGFKINEENKVYTVGKKSKKLIESTSKKEILSFKNAEDLSIHIKNIYHEQFLHFCGNLSLDILENQKNYQKIEIYKTELLYPKISEKYDAVCFFSPSGVRSFAKLNLLKGFKIFSIGKTTEKELQKFTESEIFTSSESNLEDLLLLIKNTMH